MTTAANISFGTRVRLLVDLTEDDYDISDEDRVLLRPGVLGTVKDVYGRSLLISIDGTWSSWWFLAEHFVAEGLAEDDDQVPL